MLVVCSISELSPWVRPCMPSVGLLLRTSSAPRCRGERKSISQRHAKHHAAEPQNHRSISAQLRQTLRSRPTAASSSSSMKRPSLVLALLGLLLPWADAAAIDQILPTYKIDTEIVIPATPQQVWEVFSDYDGWKEWNSFMTFTESPTEVGKLCKVLFQLDGGRMKTTKHDPEILVMDEPRELRWKDDRGFFMNLFFHGSHWFVFKETPEGHTRMVHGAQLFGLALPFIQDTMAATARGYHVWNEALSQRVQQAILAAS